MAERLIDEGFVDCPKFGIMDEQRCLPCCEFHQTKDQARVICRFGEPQSGHDSPGTGTPEGTKAVSESEEPAPAAKS
jgi:hypothetical protein